MAGHSSGMLIWSWTDLSVLGSQLFGPASTESCETHPRNWHTPSHLVRRGRPDGQMFEQFCGRVKSSHKTFRFRRQIRSKRSQ